MKYLRTTNTADTDADADTVRTVRDTDAVRTVRYSP
jgi:hypothetical protein